MTLDERIEAANVEMIRLNAPDPDGEAVLLAAFPELFSDPPTYSLAILIALIKAKVEQEKVK